MAVLSEERGERRPTTARLVGADEIAQCLRPPAGCGEFLDQTEQLCIECGRTNEIEPFDAAALRLGIGKSCPVPYDRLFHQRQQVPRQGAPRRCHGSVLFWVPRRDRKVDIDDEQLARDLKIAEAE